MNSDKQRTTYAFLILCIGIALMLAGCQRQSQGSAPANQQAEIKEFFGMPIPLQETNFAHYSLDDQYGIYLYGMQEIATPKLYLATAYAAEGEKVVPYLSERLKISTNDETTSDIIAVFRGMQRQKTYDVRTDAQLTQTLSESVSRIKQPFWRHIAERDLKYIQKT